MQPIDILKELSPSISSSISNLHTLFADIVNFTEYEVLECLIYISNNPT